MVSTRVFGNMPDGTPVPSWTLRNGSGMEVEVLAYGAIVRRISVPAKGGAVDVVLGFDGLDSYLRDDAWIGAVAGRVAGRITGGMLNLGGAVHRLPVNNPPNHLHGGPCSFNRKLWRGEPTEDGRGVRLVHHSPAGDQGYPGDLDVVITYSLTEGNELVFSTEAHSPIATPVTIAQHSYFNLAGEGSGDIMGHTLAVFADSVIPSGDDCTPLDVLLPVTGTASDLREPRTLRDVIPHVSKRHLDMYWFGDDGGMKRMAHLHCPASGIGMEVSSTHDCLQGYSAVALDCRDPGKSGRAYGAFSGVCLEAQGYPNACNAEGFGSILTEPGITRRHVTVFAFHAGNPAGYPG